MLLAAGRGTRLRPLTDAVPKILVPVAGVPMLERLVVMLARAGIREIALNTHHLPDAVRAHLAGLAPRFPELSLHPFHEPELLGTGGALANVRDFWGDAELLVWNGDILADLDLAALSEAHAASGAAATLVTQERAEPSRLLVDDGGAICGIDSPKRGGRRVVRATSGPLRAAAYCGVALLAPTLRPHLDRPGAFDLIDALLDSAAEGALLTAFDLGPRLWGTSGSPEELATLEGALQEAPGVLARYTDSR